MTPEAQRIAIAEVCGWKDCYLGSMTGKTFGWPPIPVSRKSGEVGDVILPNYTGDLNAMHEAEKVLEHDEKLRGRYFMFLDRKTGNTPTIFHVIRATAAQRAEAFLKTLNLWTES